MPPTIRLALMADLGLRAFEAASRQDPGGLLAAILAAGIIGQEAQLLVARLLRALRRRRK